MHGHEKEIQFVKSLHFCYLHYGPWFICVWICVLILQWHSLLLLHSFTFITFFLFKMPKLVSLFSFAIFLGNTLKNLQNCSREKNCICVLKHSRKVQFLQTNYYLNYFHAVKNWIFSSKQIHVDRLADFRSVGVGLIFGEKWYFSFMIYFFRS